MATIRSRIDCRRRRRRRNVIEPLDRDTSVRWVGTQFLLDPLDTVAIFSTIKHQKSGVHYDDMTRPSCRSINPILDRRSFLTCILKRKKN